MLRQALQEQIALSKSDPLGKARCLYHLALCLEKEKALPKAESFAHDSVAAHAAIPKLSPALAAYVKDSETLYERLLVQGGLAPEAAQARVKKVTQDAKNLAPPRKSAGK